VLPVFLSDGYCRDLFYVGSNPNSVIFFSSLSETHFFIPRYSKEKKTCCCDMGSEGCLCCLISTPINIFGPLGGFCWFALNSAKIRHDVASKYDIQEDTDLPSCLVGCCFPCSLFQVLMTLRNFERNGRL
jgi:hypothetical protein